MRPSSTYTLTVTATDSSGQTASAPPVSFTTGGAAAGDPAVHRHERPDEDGSGHHALPDHWAGVGAPRRRSDFAEPRTAPRRRRRRQRRLVLPGASADRRCPHARQRPHPLRVQRHGRSGDRHPRQRDPRVAGRLELGRLAKDEFGARSQGRTRSPSTSIRCTTRSTRCPTATSSRSARSSCRSAGHEADVRETPTSSRAPISSLPT